MTQHVVAYAGDEIVITWRLGGREYHQRLTCPSGPAVVAHLAREAAGGEPFAINMASDVALAFNISKESVLVGGTITNG